MEVNKDEAARCLSISYTHLHSGNIEKAIKFAEKSISLYSTDEAVTHLASLKKKAAQSSSASSSSASSSKATTSGAQAHPSAAGTTHRHTSASSSAGSATTTADSSNAQQKRDWTPEQAKIVKRVRACKVTAYYEILELQKDCEENDVKKAYRKLALQLHPDKNNAPGADEAFKLVSKAFTVLSDSNKRAIYDSSGSDPESRSGGGGMNDMFAGMGRRGGGGAQFQEVNPEDIFNMFFGQNGGFGGAQFGGPGVSFSFGPGGFQTMGGGRGGRFRQQAPPQPAQQEAQDARSTILQLLPLLVLFALSFLSSLPSLFSDSTPAPTFAFNKTPNLSHQRTTSRIKVDYFVSPKEFAAHPMWDGVTPDGTSPPPPKVHSFEMEVERSYLHGLRYDCQRRLDDRERRLERYAGVFFGVGKNQQMIKKISEERYESCELFQGYQKQGLV